MKLFRRKPKPITFTAEEVDAKVEHALRDTSARFSRILGRAAHRALTDLQCKDLMDAWRWECNQSAARHEADAQRREHFTFEDIGYFEDADHE